MTFYMLDLRLRNSKCWNTVHMCTMKKKKKKKSLNLDADWILNIYSLIHDWTKIIFGTPVKEIDRGKLRIKNMSLFVVQRFHLLIQLKSFFLFSMNFFFTVSVQVQNNFLVNNFRKSNIVLIQIFIYLLSKMLIIKESKNSYITIFFYFRNFLFTFRIFKRCDLKLMSGLKQFCFSEDFLKIWQKFEFSF